MNGATGKGSSTAVEDVKGVGFPESPTVLWGVVTLGVALVTLTCVVLLVRGTLTWFGAEGEIRQVGLAVFAAALGSAIAGSWAYLKHACEERDFQRSYGPWYLFRPLVGAMLGIVVYYAWRAGLWASFPDAVAEELPSDQLVVAMSAIVGLFSREATRKLQEVFRSLFASDEAESGVPPADTPTEQ